MSVFFLWLAINDARFDREVFSRDPMREPLQEILGLSEHRYETDHMFLEATVDELEKSILGAQK
jgi:hypothetical protein